MRFLALSIIFSLFCGTAPSFQKKKPMPNQSVLRPNIEKAKLIDEILWWLPEDTETVFVTNGPFTIPPHVSDLENNAEITPKLIENVFFNQYRAIFLGNQDRLREPLAKYEIQVGLEGSRRFRAPKSLGLLPFEGCQISVFSQNIAEIQGNLLPLLESDAVKIHSINGVRVAEFMERLEADEWHFYLTFPRPNVLLCATDEGYLTQVLERMGTCAATRALPGNLPEWAHVDVAAPFWAIRHYSRNNVDLDPTSPVSGRKLPANIPDAEAVGFVFSFDPKRTDTPTIKYLSNNRDSLALVSKEWTLTHEDFTPSFRRSEPGIVEILIQLKNVNTLGYFQLVLLMNLGHGVYL